MTQTLGLVAIVVREYDEAIAWYTAKLGFELVEDSPQSAVKRWVRVRPPGSRGTDLLLARAANAEQASRVGNQSGGRVFLFLHTDDFYRDYDAYRARGVVFATRSNASNLNGIVTLQPLAPPAANSRTAAVKPSSGQRSRS